jgi:hypothetical protein
LVRVNRDHPKTLRSSHTLVTLIVGVNKAIVDESSTRTAIAEVTAD